MEPLVPVIVTTKLPPALGVHESVAVPDPDTLLGLTALHDRLAGVFSVSEIVPVNPFRAPIVMVELADVAIFTVPGEVAVMLKSGAGGPRGWKVSRHPHPMGLLLHWTAP